MDYRSDLYSLGVTLYEALGGKAVARGQYENLSFANEAIPPQIDDLIQECLLPRDERVLTAKSFGARLAEALRPVKPLAEVLAHGKLHELGIAIEELRPDQFAKLPPGQRGLILAKTDDIVKSGDHALRFAAEQMLNLLLTRAVLISEEEYRDIVVPAIEWGFDTDRGSASLRRSLEDAACTARDASHRVIRESFCDYLSSVGATNKPGWFLHSARDVIEALLANPVCGEGAKELVRLLKEVNEAQRGLSAAEDAKGVS